MKLKLSFLLIILCQYIPLKADRGTYDKILNISVESNHYVVKHYHNWSQSTHKRRWKMVSTHQNPFLEDNNYAFIECIEKGTNKLIFRRPTPALTYLKISEDEKYIIGISNIMVWNPYQFALFDIQGKLLSKKHITSQEAKLSIEEFAHFQTNYPSEYKFLASLDRITIIGNSIFIDFDGVDMPVKLGKAWSYLYTFITYHHLSENFSETTTNCIFWFSEENPSIEFVYNDNKEIKSISLLDPAKERIIVDIN